MSLFALFDQPNFLFQGPYPDYAAAEDERVKLAGKGHSLWVVEIILGKAPAKREPWPHPKKLKRK